ncbi:MAG: hypothetical protein JSV62_08375 [Promethearchaeota archaeon]|nr:MAG: hypothetical protein JSV62_08375 [Candidatus Lokiarchaeota archaeon]
MVQDPNDMMFCNQCRMNVYPSKPKFNIKVFGFFVILLMTVFTILTIISLTIFAEIFLLIFFLWGFMIINPYLVYYGLQKKQYCPRCYDKTIEKNLSYKPFGDKEPEIYKKLTSSQKPPMTWHCPYCGTEINGNFCKSCGRKFEIKRATE